MKVLIIGGSGFIGTHLIEKMILQGNDILNFDLNESSVKKIKTIKGDIKVRTDLNKIDSYIDCVYVLAAIHRDDIADHSKYYETNFEGLNNIIDFCDSRNINKIIYYSSAAVYGDKFVNAKESDKLYPNSHYGKSKVKAEKSLKKWANKYSLRKLVIIRPSVVYGLGANSNMNRLIDYVINNKFFIIGKGENIKSISYVKNLVDFTYYISNKIESQVMIFNYSDYPQRNIRQICDQISFISKSNRVKNIPYILAFIVGCFFEVISFISNKKTTISLNRINKSRTDTSLSTKKIEEINYSPIVNLKDSMYETIQY